MRVLLVGGGGREHAVASSLCKSPGLELFTVMSNESPGIADLSVDWLHCSETDIHRIADWAKKQRVEWAFIGSEDPLAKGISDELDKVGIGSVGPKKAPAQLETSKLFTRQLMKKTWYPRPSGISPFPGHGLANKVYELNQQRIRLETGWTHRRKRCQGDGRPPDIPGRGY